MYYTIVSFYYVVQKYSQYRVIVKPRFRMTQHQSVVCVCVSLCVCVFSKQDHG